MDQHEVTMLRATSRWAAKDMSEETALTMLLDTQPKQGRFHVDARQGNGDNDVTTTVTTTDTSGKRDVQVIIPTFVSPVTAADYTDKSKSINMNGQVVGTHSLSFDPMMKGQVTQRFDASGDLRNTFSTACNESKPRMELCLTTINNPSGQMIGMAITEKTTWPGSLRSHSQVFRVKEDNTLLRAGTIDMRIQTHHQDQSLDFDVQRAKRMR